MAAPRKTTAKKASGGKGGGKSSRAPTKAAPKKSTPAGSDAALKAKMKKVPAAKMKKPAADSKPARSKAAAASDADQKSRKKREPVEAPAKLALDPELLHAIREALVNQRQQLLSVVQSTKSALAEKAVDLADVSDRASGGFEDELSVGLMAIEAAQIDEIESAIERIDEGTYGLCVDCQKPIPRKRMEVLPFAQRCVVCEDARQRRARMAGAFEEDDDDRDRDRD